MVMKNLVRIILTLILGLAGWSPGQARELDPGFGVDGRVIVEIGGQADRAQAVLVQPDGRILLAGSSSDGDSRRCSLIRLLADGSPDPAFGINGLVQVDAGPGDDEILALALMADGRIVAGGYSRGADRDFLLLRFTADGQLDQSFGRSGLVITPVGRGDDEITGLRVDPDGAVVAAGVATGTQGRVLALVRYRPDGVLDPDFGDQGMSLIGIGIDMVAQSLLRREDGSLVVAGSYTDGGRLALVLAGLTAGGDLDPAFGRDGLATAAWSGISEGYGLASGPDGSLYVSGSVGAEGSRDAALFAFTPDGRVASSFGDNGVLVIPVGPEDDVLYSLASDRENLYGGGFTTVSGTRKFLLVSAGLDSGDTVRESDSASDLVSGSSGTMRISGLAVAETLDDYTPSSDNGTTMLPAVVSTGFELGDGVGYDLAVQDDGMVVMAGTAETLPDQSSAVAARYSLASGSSAAGATASSDTSPAWINTLPVSEVTATGAFTGGQIQAAPGSVSQRGVVFSIAPYPVCKDECAGGSGDDGGDSGGGDTAPQITSTTPTSFTSGVEVTLSVTTDENATCRYRKDSDADYTAMIPFTLTGGTSHSSSLGTLTDGDYLYFVRCQDSGGTINPAGTGISFTVGQASAATRFLAPVSGLFLASAWAADTVDPDTPSTLPETPPTTPDTDEKLRKEGYTSDGSGEGLYSSILENLAPDTRYYVRAYAIIDGVIHYGPQVTFETGSACFIATAAYGSILHPAVTVLRTFRDRYLLAFSPGRAVVRWYYRNSPPLAARIARSPGIRGLVRVLLVPVIAFAWLALHPLVMALLAMSLTIAVVVRPGRCRPGETGP